VHRVVSADLSTAINLNYI